MRRRKFFGLAAAPVAASLPAVAAPIVEMHANDVAPLSPSQVNDTLRESLHDMIFRLTEQEIRRCEWIPVSDPVIWSYRDA